MPERIDITARGRACLPILVRAVSDMDHMCGTHDFKSSAACAATRLPAACATTLPPAICCVDASGCVPTSCWLGSLSSDSDSEKHRYNQSCRPSVMQPCAPICAKIAADQHAVCPIVGHCSRSPRQCTETRIQSDRDRSQYRLLCRAWVCLCPPG